ncbi:MAG: LLM class flavin-dependent oxidoreductase [Nocardioides sp.]|nr:LLM class flavin-dependent oxidoreductase [Nocardioides sp.]MDI6909217.1 LLM class flavin-dependent oxidoreductase [Nocardioides sp.]
MPTNFPRVRFGAFFGPFHPPSTNPTLSLTRDLELIEHMDRLGFAEAWMGEHHSGGIEIVSSPEIFMAAAAQRTRRIDLGLGVVSLPYHHPFMVADRMALLSHLAHGRVILGVGPGQLADDCRIIGIDPMENRRKMEESLDVVSRLLAGETVSEKTDWYTVDGYLHMLPYGDVRLAVTGAWSPNGPNLAGRYGAGLLSLGARTKEGIDLLSGHWDVACASANERGNTMRREDWRLLQLTHIAETEQQAIKDVSRNLLPLNNYMAQISPAAAEFTDIETLVKANNESGGGVIGTPDMLVAHIKRLQEETGGFGVYLMLQGDWADDEATRRSYELIASEVMPHFDGSMPPRARAFEETMTSDLAGAKATILAVDAARARFDAGREGQQP